MPKSRFAIVQFLFYGLILSFCVAAVGAPSDAEKILDGISKAGEITSTVTAPAAPFNPIFIVISSVAAAVGSFAAALRELFKNRRLEREAKAAERLK